MAEGIVLLDGVHPVLIPYRLGVGAHLTGGRVDDFVPRVVLERVVVLAAKLAAQRCAGSSLGIGPCHAVAIDVAVAQAFVGELHELLLVDEVVLLDSAARPTDGGTPRHLGATFLTLLRGDHHHTVGTTRTIQRTGRGILQDGHRLDVGGVQ